MVLPDSRPAVELATLSRSATRPGIKNVAIGGSARASGTNRGAQRAGNLSGLAVLHDKRVAVQRTAGFCRTALDAFVVETKGIEPSTSALRTRRSPS